MQLTLQTKTKRISQDIVTVLMIGLFLITGLVMLVISALNGSSFLAILGVSVAFWSMLLLFFTPTTHAFTALFQASASASGSNIERSLIEFNSPEKGVYLPPQNLRNFDSSLVFIPKTPQTALPQSNETNDRLFTEEKTGLLLTPPGLALSVLFEHELGLSFRKINLSQMQQILTKLIRDLKLADNVQVRIQDRNISLEIAGSIFNNLCKDTENTQPRTHSQVGCILTSAFACAFAKASDKPITIQKDTLNPETKALIIEYHMGEV